MRASRDLRKSDQDSPTATDDDPIPLAQAASQFFGGKVGVAGLRRERDRGHLVTMMIAGKEWTTARHVRAMLRACEGVRKGQEAPLAAAPPIHRPAAGSSNDGPGPGRQLAEAAIERLKRSQDNPRQTPLANTANASLIGAPSR